MQRLTDILFFIALAVVVIAFSFIAPSQADVAKPFQVLRQTVVHISVGSGFIAEGRSGKHYIVTADHVCRAARWRGKLAAHYQDGETVIGKIVKEDPVNDICAAEVSADHPAIQMARVLVLGERVYTRGFPGHILAETSGVTGLTAEWDDDVTIDEFGVCPFGTETLRYYDGALDHAVVAGCRLHNIDTLSTLYTQPGSSGSAVVDGNGELVGIVKSRHGDEALYQTGLVRFDPLRHFMASL